MKKSILPCVLAVSMLSAPLALASHNSDPSQRVESGQPQGKMHKHAHGLSDAQRQQIRETVSKYRQQKRSLRRQARVLKMQIDGMLVTKGTQWADIEAQVKQLSALREQMMLLRTKARFEVFQKTGLVMPPKGKHHRRYGPR